MGERRNHFHWKIKQLTVFQVEAFALLHISTQKEATNGLEEEVHVYSKTK